MITRAQYSTVRPGQEAVAGVSAQLLLLAALGTTTGLGPAGWVTGTAFAVVLWALLTSALRRAPSPTLGPADLVTLARSMLVGGVAALVADRLGAQPTAVFATLAGLALALDAVDGRVARRTGTVSALGARFDMEVDAFLILVLSVQVSLTQGAWVLTIGVMRYGFVAASWVWTWLRAPLPVSMARKTVAALQGVVLVVVSTGCLPAAAATALAATALALLAWSFGRDVRRLWSERAHSQSRRLNSTYNAPAITTIASVDTRKPHHCENPG